MEKHKELSLYAICVYIFFEILENTNFIEIIPSSLFKAIRYLLLAILSIIVFFKFVTAKFELYFLLFALIAVLTMLFANTTFMVVLFLIFYLIREYQFNKVISCFNLTLIFALVLTIACSALSIIPMEDSVRLGEYRISLGFCNCTMPMSMLMFVYLNYLYLKKNKVKLYFLIAEFAVATAFYYFTKARTGYFIILLILLLSLVIKANINFGFLKRLLSNKFVGAIIICLPILFLSITLLMTYLFAIDNDFALKLNQVLSSRLVFQNNAIREKVLTLFGADVIWFDSNGFYCGVDNSFMFYLYNYGILSSVLIYLIVSLNLRKALKNKDYLLLVILFIILCDGLVEPYLVDFKYNCFMFYIVVAKNGIERKSNAISRDRTPQIAIRNGAT